MSDMARGYYTTHVRACTCLCPGQRGPSLLGLDGGGVGEKSLDAKCDAEDEEQQGDEGGAVAAATATGGAVAEAGGRAGALKSYETFRRNVSPKL